MRKEYDFSQGERGKFYRAGVGFNFPICANCGESVRGLKNALEIAIHCHTEMRQCANGRTLAEWEQDGNSIGPIQGQSETG